MTALIAPGPHHADHPTLHLRAELVDGISEAVLWQPDQASRADVVYHLVREMYECLSWLHADASHPELESFQRLLEGAAEHRLRLGSPTGEAAPVEAAGPTGTAA